MSTWYRLVTIGAIFFVWALVTMCNNTKQGNASEEMKQKLEQFSKTEVSVNLGGLSDSEKKVLAYLTDAAKLMDSIFLRQVYEGNVQLEMELLSADNKVDPAIKEYFKIMFGPFDRLDHHRPFIPGHLKPQGANFYPADMTKENFQDWLETHPDQRLPFISEFTVIRRDSNGLKAIPYSEFYVSYLTRCAEYLRKAAEVSENASLANYLLTRAEAFFTNDYYESDKAWMDVQHSNIEIVIGPYEVYEDEMFNYKASFEAFVCVTDLQESNKLSMFADYLNDIEVHLPLPDSLRGQPKGSESPIYVVNLFFSAGDTKAGVQTLAFNLPNDERVRQEKGSKKVMMKNIHEAKFNQILLPIAREVLIEDQYQWATFEAFFNHTLMHEISHGVGPGYIRVNGLETEVKLELKETYSRIEEAKADVLGMYNNLFMVEKGVYSDEIVESIWVTYLTNIFRSVRFGINEAHGAANAMIYNFLLERDAYHYDEKTNRIAVNFEKIEPAIIELAETILIIEATGDYKAATDLLKQYAVDSPSLMKLRSKLVHIPVDIYPEFTLFDQK